MLSAGRDRNAVVTDARIAEMLGRDDDWGEKRGRMRSVII